jgi:hypothetical protein
MSVIKSVFFCFSLVLVAGISANGQAAKSPFSTYGVGEHYGFELAHNQGMGGLGFSQPQYWYLNNQNPALLTYNHFTVFQAGMVGEQLTDGVNSESTRGGNMNYLAVAFPIKFNKITTSVGLMPYTNVNYKLSYVTQVENSTDTVNWQDTGEGGLTQVYWANGFKLTSDISVGIRASYVFGSVAYTVLSSTQVDDQPIPFVYGSQQKTYSRGFLLSGGVSYSKDSLFNGNYRLSIGAVYELDGRLSSSLTESQFLLNGVSGDTLSIDAENNIRGKLSLPAAVGGGISFGKDRKWALGIDYYVKDWNNFKSLSSNGYQPGKMWRLAVGAEFIPDYASLNYFKRVTYRAGISQAPFFANGKKVNDFGINFGLSLPTGRSSIDLAVKTGRRGTVADNGLKENYFKIYLGITLNDQWFIKRKFD